MANSPTVNSLKWLRDAGYRSQVVEKWVPHANVRQDLYGIIDIIGIHHETGEVLAVQATSYSNVSARVKKCLASENLELIRRAGWKLQVHGWRKKGARWTVRTVTV